ncbi:MAG: YesL family protein [Marvinbryantia sp.]|uniref:YesL family protein n=1 Tax=Marvinbryantia sp. TaxID=2496532 RepID=UPI002612C6CF|nr:DUF624 domain-containing protein [uncultured Marvinbryantia sp.]
MNIFSFNSWLSRFLYLVADIVLLHILWIICSLPIVTIGASTTALYSSCMKRIRRDEGYITGNFFRAFKSNFRQSTLIWLLLLAVGGILYMDLWIGLSVEGVLGKIMLVSCSMLLIPFFCTVLYIFPVQAKFENRILDNLKNAFLMSLSNFQWTLFLAFILATFVLLTLVFPPFMGLMLIAGAGIFGYLTSCVFVYVFRKYLPDELQEDAMASRMDQEQ